MKKMEIELSDIAAAVLAKMVKRGRGTVKPEAIVRTSFERTLSMSIDLNVNEDGEEILLREARDAEETIRETWADVVEPGPYAAVMRRKPGSRPAWFTTTVAGPETRRLLDLQPTNPDLVRVDRSNGYVVWNLNAKFRKMLRPIARKFGGTVEEFLRSYSTGRLANQQRERRLDESDVPAGFSVNLGNDQRALERIFRAVKFSKHTVESLAWQSIAGSVDCCEDDMIFHPITGEPIGDEIGFSRFIIEERRWPVTRAVAA